MIEEFKRGGRLRKKPAADEIGESPTLDYKAVSPKSTFPSIFIPSMTSSNNNYEYRFGDTQQKILNTLHSSNRGIEQADMPGSNPQHVELLFFPKEFENIASAYICRKQYLVATWTDETSINLLRLCI